MSDIVQCVSKHMSDIVQCVGTHMSDIVQCVSKHMSDIVQCVGTHMSDVVQCVGTHMSDIVHCVGTHMSDIVIFNPFTAMGHFHKEPTRWPTFLAMLFQILKEGMGLSLLDELKVRYHAIKRNVIETYYGAKVTVFARFESESARRRPLLVFLVGPTPLVEIFTGPFSDTRSSGGEGEDIFAPLGRRPEGLHRRLLDVTLVAVRG